MSFVWVFFGCIFKTKPLLYMIHNGMFTFFLFALSHPYTDFKHWTSAEAELNLLWSNTANGSSLCQTADSGIGGPTFEACTTAGRLKFSVNLCQGVYKEELACNIMCAINSRWHTERKRLFTKNDNKVNGRPDGSTLDKALDWQLTMCHAKL